MVDHWKFRPVLFGAETIPATGVILILAGVPGVVDSFAQLALQGLGAPAPVAPPRRLVVTGLSRFLRYLMYVSP
jgi:hypothetical protein